jgi:hypothetical protein
VQCNNRACQRRALAVAALQGGVERRGSPCKLVMLGLVQACPGHPRFSSGRSEHVDGRIPSPGHDDSEIAGWFAVRKMCRSRHSQPESSVGQ